MTSYDALLLVSFGGPEGPQDVMPFLENVTRGRNVPRERLEKVAEHYHLFGGVSPINQHCRDLKAAIEADFAAHGVDLPVYWGNRNWDPYLTDTVRQMADDGIRRAAAFVTSAYSGFSSCGQYAGDIARARAAVPGAPEIDKLRVYFNHPGFVEPFVEATRAALDRLPEDLRGRAHVAFSAHSVPMAQPGRERYAAELADISAHVAAQAAPGHDWRLVYQSRSGPPGQPWLEPDIGDHLEELHAAGTRAVVVVPIGFVSDHMEVKYDLDVEAAELAAKLGLAYERAATPGTHPRYVSMVRELLAERTAGPDAPRPALGTLGARPDVCPAECGHA
ncbi:ferrochelatase [Thermomonospora cellulosilytica]|uniref:Coproporphyrin III ferrochelatase n=1 Tax=Thermomonospora cellulosilytica TaxID=1411118 RepID=A0A7W3MZ40_9ACTN|nr:ferrochelatase [Thermomonospora cellulosilytica]MBA9004526.1 ferrochelatase [Thermomonospora cellulosilytica]